jgi:membrane-bound lytic murein transglycosylase D
VPKLIAAIIIATDPEQYGFTDLVYKKPLEYELLDVRPRLDLAAVAVSGSISVKKLRKLNNELRRNQTPYARGSYTLKVPTGTRDRIAANLPRAHAIVTTKFKTHKVCKHDTLRQVSKKYHISMTTLLKANKLSSSKLKVGQHLRIPYRSNKYVLLKKGQSAKDFYAANSGRMIMHELARGETLSKVARQYNVPVEMLIQWNDIKNVRRIRAGYQLAIYMGRGSSTGALQVASATPSPREANETVLILADSKKRKPGVMGSVEQLIALQESKSRAVESADTAAEQESIITLTDRKKQRPADLVLASLEKTTEPVETSYKQSVLTEIISLSDHKKRRPDHNSDVPAATVSYYKVRSGDSLWSIARKLKVTTLDLKRWNGLRSDKLQPGTRLVIRKG